MRVRVSCLVRKDKAGASLAIPLLRRHRDTCHASPLLPSHSIAARGGAMNAPSAELHIPEALQQAVAGVLRNAHAGALPPFARTLGLPQAALLEVLRCCLPRLATDAIPERKYAALMQNMPALFDEVRALLMAQRTPDADPLHVEWLARAIAAACMGNRFLWQDMGLAGRDDVGVLLRRYFQPLHDANREDLKWKRFIFLQLGARKKPAGPPALENIEGLAVLPTLTNPGTVR